jgi:hypothetical protein
MFIIFFYFEAHADQRATLIEIYGYLQSRYDFFRQPDYDGWKVCLY